MTYYYRYRYGTQVTGNQGAIIVDQISFFFHILHKLYIPLHNIYNEMLYYVYREDVCMDKLESCLKEDKRRKRILKKLFFKKYNALRQELIGYGGRRLWGGEGNLFYR